VSALFAGLLVLVVGACVRVTKQGDLIYKGTVTKIEIADTGDPLREWVVTTRVDRVVCGSFSGDQFKFAVHSPARSGIEVGKQYRIVAKRVPDGYEVDPDEWRPSWSFWVCG
jgi:hypothetical protein